MLASVLTMLPPRCIAREIPFAAHADSAYTPVMIAVVLALMGAVCLAAVYVTATERMDYGSLHRRQLDVWASLAALVCLGGILFGGADAQRQLALRPYPERPGVAATIVPRLLAADLGHSDGAPQAEAVASDHVLASASDALPDGGPGAGPDEMRLRVDSDVRRSGRSSGGGASSPAGGEKPAYPFPTAVFAPMIGATPQPSAAVDLLPTTTPPLVRIATRFRDGSVTGTPTPTVGPPTAVPTAAPSVTPHCGDPQDIRLRVERLDTTLDRSDGDLAVRYSARIRNESLFPATMADVVVTALNQTAGSEYFGHATRPDITLAPGAVIGLAGAVTLTKSPPPFGSTDLCLSFVGETCGQRPPYSVIRRCRTVRGF